MSWEIFYRDFLDTFFFRFMRETKVEEFINLRQGGTIVLDYSLNFTKLSKYYSYLMPNPRDEMSFFLTRVFDDFVE